MYLDVTELQEFYARPLGVMVRRLISGRARMRWRNMNGLNIYGLGYATPYLGVFRSDACQLGAFMPAAQGVILWPSKGPLQSVLVDERNLPLPDASVDRMIIVHCLEMCEATADTLREIWRVLSPEGRILLIVPNRRGVWARLDTTPFGHGRPYSRGQLRRLLCDALFDPLDWEEALFMPPAHLRLLLRSAGAWERLGSTFWPAFSGILMVEARKTVYAASPKTGLEKIRGRLSPVHTTPFKT